jgi:hypothetical protein
MPMRERRGAHVRPLPPSSERLRSHQIKASAPSRELVRRYRPVRTNEGVPPPISVGVIGVFLVLGIAMLIVGGNILVSVVGQVAHAFDNAMAQVASMPPATMAPSGVALDTPVLDAPANDGYTNQATVSLSGSVPAAVVGLTGYNVRVYVLASDGTRSQVAEMQVGATAHFSTPAIALVEGPNTFVAALVTPSTEGQASPPVVYTLDTVPPNLSVASPADGSTQSGSSVVVSGKTDPGSTVTIRNKQAPGGGLSSKVVGQDGQFAITVGLVAGSNSIEVTATDQAGNVSTDQLTVKRSYGQLSAHLSASPAKFAAAGPTTIKLTAHATSANGGPMAGAQVVFTVTVAGLGPIVSPELTTDQTGTATWKVTVSGATPGVGAATVMVSTSDGSQVLATTTLTTT